MKFERDGLLYPAELFQRDNPNPQKVAEALRGDKEQRARDGKAGPSPAGPRCEATQIAWGRPQTKFLETLMAFQSLGSGFLRPRRRWRRGRADDRGKCEPASWCYKSPKTVSWESFTPNKSLWAFLVTLREHTVESAFTCGRPAVP